MAVILVDIVCKQYVQHIQSFVFLPSPLHLFLSSVRVCLCVCLCAWCVCVCARVRARARAHQLPKLGVVKSLVGVMMRKATLLRYLVLCLDSA